MTTICLIISIIVCLMLPHHYRMAPTHTKQSVHVQRITNNTFRWSQSRLSTLSDSQRLNLQNTIERIKNRVLQEKDAYQMKNDPQMYRGLFLGSRGR